MDDELIRWDWVRRHLDDAIIPAFTQHVVLCVLSVGIALAISLPLGIAVARHSRAYAFVTFITGLLYTIPSLSFFALLISLPGIKIGRTPAIIALVAYSLLVLIRNVVVGLNSVPSETREAARGMGLTSGQVLWQVELPLALPVIVAGIRIATVSTIGIATIAAYISNEGLGTLIFQGIDQQFSTKVLLGGGIATLMAVVADVGLLGFERLARPWSLRGGRAV